MKFGEHVIVVQNEDKFIMTNKENGQWIRLSEEVYQILRQIVEENLDINMCEQFFEEPTDFSFVKDLYLFLEKAQIICPDDWTLKTYNKIVSIQLTNKCNLRCKHCCVDAGESIDMNVELSTDEIKEIFDKVIRWKPRNIMLSGGEPMYRKDFKELLEYLRNNYSGKIVLSTNAMLINENNIRWLVNWCDAFEISIDGVDEDTCSAVRGKGVFNKVCESVRLIKKYTDKPINMSMVFSEKNDYLVPKFKELNKKMGTEAICRAFVPRGRGETNKALFSSKAADDVYINSEFLCNENKTPFGITTCAAGVRELFIRCDGLIQPCPSYMEKKYSLGNILKIDDISEVIENNSVVFSSQVLENSTKPLEECKECKVRLFCWTCPGESMDIKTKEALKKRCDIMKPILMKRVWEDEILM